MTIETLMKFGRAYNDLGWAVQSQLQDVVNGDYDDLNLAALDEMERSLKGYHEDLDAALTEARNAVEPD